MTGDEDDILLAYAADALRRYEGRGKYLLPWDRISNAQRMRWRVKANVVIQAHESQKSFEDAMIAEDDVVGCTDE